MKRCVSCQREIPEPAMHCVFCGSRQELQKTLMGYAPGDAWKGRAASPSQGAYGGPGVPAAPPQSPTLPAAHAPGSSPHAFGPSSYGPGPYGPPPGPPGQSGPFGGPAVPPAPAPVPVAPSWSGGPMAQPAWTPLASYAPFEPWQRAVRVVCLVFGLILVVTFLAPRSFEPLVFGWDVLRSALSASAIAAVAVAALGLLAAVLALLPVSTAARATVAAAAGVGAEVMAIAVAPAVEWRLAAYVLGVLLVAGGMLLRAQYRASMLARVATTIGALSLLLPHVVPVADQVPLVTTARALGQTPGIHILAPIIILAVALAALVAMVVVWLPPTTSAVGTVLAWLIIALPVALLAVPVLADPDVLGRDPQNGYFLASVLATRVLAAYGLASLAGKALEEG